MADQASAPANAATPIATPARSDAACPAVGLMAAKVEPPSDEATSGLSKVVILLFTIT